MGAFVLVVASTPSTGFDALCARAVPAGTPAQRSDTGMPRVCTHLDGVPVYASGLLVAVNRAVSVEADQSYWVGELVTLRRS